MIGRWLGTGTALLVLLSSACGGDSEGGEAVLPVVLVPNPVLADLVERVACTGDVEVIVPESTTSAAREPALEVVLDPSGLDTPAAADGGPMVVSIIDTVATIDVGDGDDTWVWLDPLRMIQVSQTIGAAMVASGEFEAEVVDRCLARVQLQLEELSNEMLALADELPDEQRIIAVDEPGTVYFADSFNFVLDTSAAAIEAGDIMSSDDLDGHESYDAMMLANTTAAIEVLRQSG